MLLAFMLLVAINAISSIYGIINAIIASSHLKMFVYNTERKRSI